MVSIADQLARAWNFDAAMFTAWCTAGERVGWIENGFVRTLLESGDGLIDLQHGRLALRAKEEYEARSAVLERIALRLRKQGNVTGWREERYAIASPSSGEPLFELERAAVRRFGVAARAAHLNAWVGSGPAFHMWVARRAASKPVDPDMLDNLVGGGIAVGMSPETTLRKECMEEAGISGALAAGARAAGSLRVRRTVENGLHDETLYAYDLELPPDFAPQNRDGEVAEFLLLGSAELTERIAAGEFTVDAGAVAIDFLRRRGLIRDRAVEVGLARLRGS
jgi:8-oxo-dGTP pyrophosphatase MutT (NUDIX family)